MIELQNLRAGDERIACTRWYFEPSRDRSYVDDRAALRRDKWPPLYFCVSRRVDGAHFRTHLGMYKRTVAETTECLEPDEKIGSPMGFKNLNWHPWLRGLVLTVCLGTSGQQRANAGEDPLAVFWNTFFDHRNLVSEMWRPGVWNDKEWTPAEINTLLIRVPVLHPCEMGR